MNRVREHAGACAPARAVAFVDPNEKENQIMQFQKGQSGNPAGRPRGSRNKTTVLLQNLLEGEAEEIARKAIEMAKAGDMGAIRVCMDPPRIDPPEGSGRLRASGGGQGQR
jgi:hypothetical protein